MWQMTRGWRALAVATLVAVGSSAAARDEAPAPGTTEAYFGTFYKPVCDKLISGFAPGTQASWPAWERRNHEAVAALEGNREFQARRKEALVPPPPELLEAKTQELSTTCERLANLFEGALPADARFDAPEHTWETFRKALREGNREALGECLTGEAKKSALAPFQAMTNEQLQRTAEAIAELKVMPGNNGGFQEALVIQKNGAAGRIGFLRNGANWKISQM